MEYEESSRLEKSFNDEFEKQWFFQLDYIKPIGKEGKVETGVRTSFRNMVNDYIVARQNGEVQVMKRCPDWITFFYMMRIFMRYMAL